MEYSSEVEQTPLKPLKCGSQDYCQTFLVLKAFVTIFILEYRLNIAI